MPDGSPADAPSPDGPGDLTPERTAAQSIISLHGRYSRKKYWLWSLVLLCLMVLMVFPLAAMNSPTGGGGGLAVLVVLSLLFLGLYCKLMVHRLHDLGYSGWVALAIVTLFVVLPSLMYRESHEIYLRIEQSYEAQQAIKGYVLFLMLGSVVLSLGGFIAMGSLRGTKGANKYGPDPRAGVSAG